MCCDRLRGPAGTESERRSHRRQHPAGKGWRGPSQGRRPSPRLPPGPARPGPLPPPSPRLVRGPHAHRAPVPGGLSRGAPGTAAPPPARASAPAAAPRPLPPRRFRAAPGRGGQGALETLTGRAGRGELAGAAMDTGGRVTAGYGCEPRNSRGSVVVKSLDCARSHSFSSLVRISRGFCVSQGCCKDI